VTSDALSHLPLFATDQPRTDRLTATLSRATLRSATIWGRLNEIEIPSRGCYRRDHDFVRHDRKHVADEHVQISGPSCEDGR